MAYETLSSRGRATANTSMRKILTPILADNYDLETNPTGYVNMGTAENYIMTPAVSAFANQTIRTTSKTFTYGQGPWGSNRLRQAMASHMSRHFHSVDPINADDILFANGITSLCELIAFTIAEPNDAILLPSPIYQAFQTDFSAKAGLKCVFAPFHGSDQFAPECTTYYEEALRKAEANGTKVRALLLCNPHNPLGKCYPKSTLIALMRFCQSHKIHLLADEVYALSVYDIDDEAAEPFTSVLSFDSSEYIDRNLLHVLYGFSKDFASGGLRLGCMHSRNPALMDAVGAITQFAWSGSMNELVAISMLEDRSWLDGFVAESRKLLAEGNLLVRGMLDGKGIPYFKGSNAGFFIWMDLRPWLPKTNDKGEVLEDAWDREAELVRRFSENKLYFTDGKSLSAEEAGWFRVIFSQEHTVVKEGFRRLFKIIGV